MMCLLKIFIPIAKMEALIGFVEFWFLFMILFRLHFLQLGRLFCTLWQDAHNKNFEGLLRMMANQQKWEEAKVAFS